MSGGSVKHNTLSEDGAKALLFLCSDFTLRLRILLDQVMTYDNAFRNGLNIKMTSFYVFYY